MNDVFNKSFHLWVDDYGDPDRVCYRLGSCLTRDWGHVIRFADCGVVH